MFIRSENGYVQLVRAKNRLAPLKPIQTIPRLELLACVVGRRLYTEVTQSLENVGQIFFWTDSSVVLHWLKRNETKHVFIKNRVNEIRLHTNIKDWRHLPGLKNCAADLLSRGCNPLELVNSRWWEGPDWLKESSEYWPNSEIIADEVESLTCINLNDGVEVIETLIGKFSKFKTILRILSWIRRFICLKTNKIEIKGEPTEQEIQNSEKLLLKYVQKAYLNEKEKSLNNLVIFTDSDGLIRLKSKLVYSQDAEYFVKPIILPNKTRITDLIIEHYHNSLGHAGTETTLAQIRMK